MNEFSQYIKLIGKGKRAGKYLTVEQAYNAFTLILKNKVEPEQVGAFLMLLRVREESAEELAGFVKAAREFTNKDITQLSTQLDMGCYAGKRRHLPWFLLAVICLAGNGMRIFLHGCTEPDSNRLYTNEVLGELGLPIASNAQEANQQIQKQGFSYMDLADVNHQLHHLIQLRHLFGLRSPANTLARMLNPSNAMFSYHGVFHKHFDERHVQVAKLLNDNAVSCIRGEGGEVEVNPERAFSQYLYKNSEITINEYPTLLENWQIKPAELNPSDLKQLWRGELDFNYGTQAIVGTIASVLTLTEGCSVTDALSTAQVFWLDRDKSFFD